MKWIEIKMKELGVTSHLNYKITFMLDYMAMISVHTPKYGVVEVSMVPSITDFGQLVVICSISNFVDYLMPDSKYIYIYIYIYIMICEQIICRLYYF